MDYLALVKKARQKGICLSALDDEQPMFIIEMDEIFRVPQTLAGLQNFLKFLEEEGVTDNVACHYVALKSSLRGMRSKYSTNDRVYWVKRLVANKDRNHLSIDYVHMYEWIAGEEMRPKAKHVIYAPGWMLEPSFPGFQRLINEDGSAVKFLGFLPLSYIPNFMVGWTVAYPL